MNPADRDLSAQNNAGEGASARWWVLLPLLSAGLLTSAAVLIAAARLRSRLLLLAALGYGTLVVALCSLIDTSADNGAWAGAPATALDRLGLVVWGALWLGGTGHVLVLQRLSRQFEPDDTPTGTRAESDRPADPAAGLSGGPTADPATGHTAGPAAGPAGGPTAVVARWLRARRGEARAMLASNPALAVELRVGRPDLAREYDDGGLVDVNQVAPAVLARMLDLDWRIVERIDAERRRVGGFACPAELVARCPELTADGIRRISDRLVFGPPRPGDGHATRAPRPGDGCHVRASRAGVSSGAMTPSTR